MRSETETFIINPYIAGSPVKNPTMFFGRDDVYAWLRQHLRGRYQDNIIVLYGERRSGKTSVLYQMGEQLGDNTYVPVLLDLQSMSLEGVDGFLWEIARKIVLSLRGVEGVPLLDRPARRDFEGNAFQQFEEGFLPPILAALGGRRLLLMFDEANRLEEKIESGDLPATAVNYLRSLVQHSNRVNFIFSIGSRVEESNRLSFELFNLAVYRKISFLEQDFAEDLITKPIEQYYTYTPEAIERIFELTSGQAYYTQLLCHNLFTYWTDGKPSQLDVADVDAVLPDIIEQATPNLQFAWDDSSPVEKATLAALASKLPEYRAGVMRRNLDRALRKAELYPPPGDITTGLKRLFERDIINRQEPYRFRVGFLQLWLNEFKPLDWVHEELVEDVKIWQQREEKRLAEAPTPVEQARQWALPVLAGVLIGGLAVALFWTSARPPAVDDARADELATQVLVLQQQVAAAETEVAAAEVEGNSAEVEAAKTTATAAAAQAATAQAAVVEVVESTSTQVANAISAAETQQAIARATISAGQRELAAFKIIPTAPPPPPPNTQPPPSPPPPTFTQTPVPPTQTQIATATPFPATRTPTPTPGPRGRLAIPVDNRAGNYDVLIFSAATGEQLGQIRNARQPSFSPDGRQLAVKALRGDNDTIWVFDANGQNGRQMSTGPADSHPRWSPDGQGLVFENKNEVQGGDLVYRIFVQNSVNQGTRRDRLAGNILDADSPLSPLWADNGDIVFYACDYWVPGSNGSQCGIWRTPSTATEGDDGFVSPTRLSSILKIPTDVRGNRLLAMANENQNWDVYLASTTGNSEQNVTNNPAEDGLAVFSPDGIWIAYVSNRGGGWGAYITPSGGGPTTRLPIENLQFAAGGDRHWTTERISWGP